MITLETMPCLRRVPLFAEPSVRDLHHVASAVEEVALGVGQRSAIEPDPEPVPPPPELPGRFADDLRKRACRSVSGSR